jgi:predicted lipoprotein with Yx(FWY)xxD motif
MSFRSTAACAAVVTTLFAACSSMSSMMGSAPTAVADGVLTGKNGMTLYTFDRDVAGSGEAQIASVSAQMLSAHASAMRPSSALAALDRPPDPGTTLKVLSTASYWWTVLMCTASRAVT